MQRTIYSSEYRYFLELMVQARMRRGITQAQLVAQLNKPQSFISKYENGERLLDVIEFIAICRALKVDPKRIFHKLLRMENTAAG